MESFRSQFNWEPECISNGPTIEGALQFWVHCVVNTEIISRAAEQQANNNIKRNRFALESIPVGPEISCDILGKAAAIEYNNWIAGFITGFGPGQPEGTEVHFWVARDIFNLYSIDSASGTNCECLCEDEKYTRFDNYTNISIQEEFDRSGIVAVVRRISGHSVFMGLTRPDIRVISITGPKIYSYVIDLQNKANTLFNSFFLILGKDKEPADYELITFTTTNTQGNIVGVNQWPQNLDKEAIRSPY